MLKAHKMPSTWEYAWYWLLKFVSWVCIFSAGMLAAVGAWGMMIWGLLIWIVLTVAAAIWLTEIETP